MNGDQHQFRKKKYNDTLSMIYKEWPPKSSTGHSLIFPRFPVLAFLKAFLIFVSSTTVYLAQNYFEIIVCWFGNILKYAIQVPNTCFYFFLLTDTSL